MTVALSEGLDGAENLSLGGDFEGYRFFRRGLLQRVASASVILQSLQLHRGANQDTPGAHGGQVVTGGGTESMGRHRHLFRRVQPLSCQVITGMPKCFGPCPIWCVISCPG